MTDYVCHYCYEPLSYDGPRGNGDESEAFALSDGEKACLFCSEACATAWCDTISVGELYGKDISLTDGKPAL